MLKAPTEILLEDERFELKPKSGGGLLSYEVWGYKEKSKTVITRYNLAYINHAIYRRDNGRVLGFDNAHGYHPAISWARSNPSSSKVTKQRWNGSSGNGCRS